MIIQLIGMPRASMPSITPKHMEAKRTLDVSISVLATSPMDSHVERDES